MLALPVLRLLKQYQPKAEIFWWIETSFAPLLEGDPDLSGLILFDRRKWQSPLNWAEPVRSVRAVRRQHFDWVIDLQALARSAAFGWFANGGLFVGLDDSREWASGFYDVAVRRPSSRHAADWYLEVLPALGIPVHSNFVWLPPRPEVARQITRKWPVAGHRWIVLQPGARWSTKRWPPEHFATVVREFSGKRPEFRFVILGGKSDVELGSTISSGNPDACLDLTGKTSLPEMIEWIRACELMITNDTGPMHTAVALQKPLVALLGPTDPLHTGPHRRPQDVLQLDLPCVPCRSQRCTNIREMDCLRGISPPVVIAAMEKRLP